MTEHFDPYHRWLGIPLAEQPANHYRLLGLVAFEDDPEVIRDAAERQMAHVRGYALGQYADLSQKILNELAAAKATLLDRDRRAAYAATIRAQVVPPPLAPIPSDDIYELVSPIPVERPPGVLRRLERAAPIDRASNPRSTSGSPSFRWKSLPAAGGAAVVFLLVVGLFVLSRGPREAEPTAPPSIEEDQVAGERNGRKQPRPMAVRGPKLARISKRTIDGGALLQFKARTSDLGSSPKSVRFELLADAPEGAAIDAQTGIFSWTPTRGQTPGTHPVAVRVLADGGLDDQTTFQVTVREPPCPRITYYPTSVQTVHAGKVIRFTVRAANAGQPPAMCAFGVSEAPPWVSINSATGQVTCAPPSTEANGTHSFVVRVVHRTMEDLRDEKNLTVAVIEQQQSANRLGGQPEDYELRLPSGKVFSLDAFDLREAARRESDALLGRCRNKSPDALGMFQEGSQSAIAALCGVKGPKPHGPAVLFHAGGGSNPKPRLYATYRGGRWDGPLATWDAEGHREFYGNYCDGKRQEVCCLFSRDALTAILECTDNEIHAVHLIDANQVTKSLTNLDQSSPGEAGPVLAEFNAVEKRLKDDSRSFCERVKQGVNLRLGAINKQKRDAISARSAERGAASQRELENLRQKGGW